LPTIVEPTEPTTFPPTTELPTEPITELPTIVEPTEPTTFPPTTEPPTEPVTELPTIVEPTCPPSDYCDEPSDDCGSECDCLPVSGGRQLESCEFTYELIAISDFLGRFRYEIVLINTGDRIIYEWEIFFRVASQATFFDNIIGADVHRQGNGLTLHGNRIWDVGTELRITLQGWRPPTTRFAITDVAVFAVACDVYVPCHPSSPSGGCDYPTEYIPIDPPTCPDDCDYPTEYIPIDPPTCPDDCDYPTEYIPIDPPTCPDDCDYPTEYIPIDPPTYPDDCDYPTEYIPVDPPTYPTDCDYSTGHVSADPPIYIPEHDICEYDIDDRKHEPEYKCNSANIYNEAKEPEPIRDGLEE